MSHYKVTQPGLDFTAFQFPDLIFSSKPLWHKELTVCINVWKAECLWACWGEKSRTSSTGLPSNAVTKFTSLLTQLWKKPRQLLQRRIYVYLCMHTCMVAFTCVCTAEVSSIVFYLIFRDNVSQWELTILDSQAASEPLGFSCLCPPSDSVIDMHCWA